MKVKFTQTPGYGHPYKAGDVFESHGPVEEGYARKYVARGWAIEHKDEPPASKSSQTVDKPFPGGYAPAGGVPKPSAPTTGSGVAPAKK